MISARRLFTEKGFDATTVDEIAADAGVDPVTVQQLLGDEAQIMVSVLGLPFNPEQIVPRILEGPRNEVGLAVLRYVIKLEPLASADTAEVVAPTVQRYIDDE